MKDFKEGSPKLTRRSFLMTTAALAATSGAGFCETVTDSANRDFVTDLMVDRTPEPLGLGSTSPRFSWRLRSSRRGARQVACQIWVASTPEALAAGKSDLWDSGKINETRSIDIPYGGAALESRKICYWSVQVWNELGAAVPVGNHAQFELGLLKSEDWVGSWVAAENEEGRLDRLAGLHWIWGSEPTGKVSRKFQFPMNIARKPIQATLLIAARNSLDGVWLDGKPLAYTPFRPGPVDFWRMVTIELPLSQGKHVLQAEATAPQGSTEGALAAIVRLKFADGSEQRLTSGADWRTATDLPSNWRSVNNKNHRNWQPSVVVANKPAGWPFPAAPAVQLRKSFNVDEPVMLARLYITALGGYEPRLNGKKVGTALLTPENTDYTKRVLARTYDVTKQIRQGENVLGAVVGDGWYASRALFSSRFPFGPPPRRLLAQLELTFASGRIQSVATGSGWQMKDGPLLSADIYDGEVYDARNETPGWDSPGFDAQAWSACREAEKPEIAVRPQASPPIRVVATMVPVSVRNVEPGVHVFDFGQNFAGWCRLRARAPAGSTVEIKFAERLLESGRVDQSNLRSALGRVLYTFSGKETVEEYQPTFTYFGFRYVEITGLPGDLPADLLDGVVISTDLPLVGTFNSSNPLLNRIWANTYWSQRSNFVGIPTDCPQRDERLGWMGDAQVFWDTATFNMDVDAFTRRFTADIRDAQNADGAFADYNPQPATGPMRGSPGWADAGILLPWTAWWRYGDTAIIDENWSAMERYLEYILRANPDFVWREKRGIDYGDWLALDAKEPGDPTTPKDLVATAYWALTTAKMAEMAGVTGRKKEAQSYGELSSKIRQAFAEHFVDANGKVGNGSQTGYVLSLKFNLLPPRHRQKAVDALVEDIRRRGVILSTGFLGTPHALDVLADAGHVDLVANLLMREAYPSWGYMVSKGATTMWERWNGDVGDVSMNSFNHYAFGAVTGFLYRRLAGIDAEEPGFKRIRIAPLVIPGLSKCKANLKSPYGDVSVSWTHSADGRVPIDVVVPPNTTAKIHLPTHKDGRIQYFGRTLVTNHHVRLLQRTEREAIVECDAGEHQFVGLV